METDPDGRLLVYRSEDIKNISRLASPKVCGYVNAKDQDLLPEQAREEEEGNDWTGSMSACVTIKVHGFVFVIDVPQCLLFI